MGGVSHCASRGSELRPLALVVAVAVGGVLPGLPTTVTVCATMVAQIHGCNCAPANTGPPMGWLVMVILALPWVVRTVNKLSPLLRPLTTPM